MNQKHTPLQVALDFDRLAGRLGYAIDYGHNYDLFVRYLPEQRDSALDVGCGTGGLMRQLAPHFRSVTGIDLSRGMIDLACQARAGHFMDQLSWATADVMSPPFASQSFDYIVSHSCLHHVPNLTEALKEIRRLLRPGGRTVLLDCVQFFPWRVHSHWIRGSRLYAMFRSFWKVIGRGELHRDVYNYYMLKETDPVWREHLRRDRFLYAWRFARNYRAVLPGAKIDRTGIRMAAIWDKPTLT
jgi:ubiquinone/menaquinone biosynthesis C-methylase UbiE